MVQSVVVGLALWHLYVLMDQEATSGSGDGGGLYPLKGCLQWPTSCIPKVPQNHQLGT